MRFLFPTELTKYVHMSKRQRRAELKTTLWYMPLLYVLGSLLLAFVTLYLDNVTKIPSHFPDFFMYRPSVTRVLISSLIGGILTLTAFTFNSILMVLTTFSGQFSPRLLLNFVSDSRTQHVLGIFTGSFIYVLTVFLFVTSNNHQLYTVIPVTTVLLALLTILAFIYFINHVSTWMQVHNITYNMKNVSERMIFDSINTELQPYRAGSHVSADILDSLGAGKSIKASQSGYIQIVDYIHMIEKASQDDAVISLHYRVGEYVLQGVPLLTYWTNKEGFEESKYSSLIILGKKQTEIQDLGFGINKLSEIALKSLGNDDPKTTIHTIYNITELLYSVSRLSSFEPYLVDENKEIRVILQQEDFNYYLNESFSMIRYYAQTNVVIIGTLIEAIILLARALDAGYHPALWQFAAETYQRLDNQNIYPTDRKKVKNKMNQLAELTNNTNSIDDLLNDLKEV